MSRMATESYQIALTHAALSFTVGAAKRWFSFPSKTSSKTLGSVEFSMAGRRALCSAPISPGASDLTSMHARSETTSVLRIPCVVVVVRSICDPWSTASQVIHTGRIDDDVDVRILRWRSGPMCKECVGEVQILDPTLPLSTVNGSGSRKPLGFDGIFFWREDGTESLDTIGTVYDSSLSFPNRLPFLNTDNRFRNDCRRGEVFLSTLAGGVDRPVPARVGGTGVLRVPCAGQALGGLLVLMDSNRIMSSLVERRRRTSFGLEFPFDTGMEKYSS
jgi:hypothetical protein